MNLAGTEKTTNLASIKHLKMKLTEMKAINRDPEFSNLWISNQKHILLLLTVGGSVMVLFWQIFDKYYIEAFDVRLPWLRWITLAVFTSNLLLGFIRNSPPAIKQHLIAGFYLGTVFCMLLAVFTGASQSPYWFGLFFIIVAWFVLVPYNFREMMVHSLVFVTIFFAGLIFQSEFMLVPHEMGKIVFLYTGALFVSLFAAYIRNQLDAANNKIKNELETKNQELLTSNKELTNEIENHKTTTKKLTEYRQFLDNILSNAPIVIWSIDLNGVFTYSQYNNPNRETEGNRVGKSALEVYRGTEVEKFIRKVLNEEVTNDVIFVDGIYYDTRISPIYNDKNEKTGYLGVSMDISSRIKNEKELDKFRLVLDQAPGAVFIMDRNSNFEYLNRAFTQISGYTENDLLHKNINETLYRGISEIPESRREIIKTLSDGKSWHGELLTTHKNGTKYWANTIAAPYKSAGGLVDGFIVIQQDITEKKQMQMELAEKENLYRSLIEKSLDGIVISQDGKVVMVNKAFADMIGYTMDECIENFGPHSIAPEDRDRVLGIHYQRMKGEISDLRYNAGLLCKNGEKLIAEFNSTTIEINGRPASLISIRDITERIKMQETLEKNEQKYKTLVENSLEGISIIRDNKVLFANDTVCKMLGYTREELYSMPSVNMLHPDDYKMAYEIAERRQNHDSSTIHKVMRMKTKDGKTIECETSSTLIEFEGVWASFFTSHDITEKKRMEEELVKSEQKYRELADFMPQTIFELDKDLKLVYMNKTGMETFGLTEANYGESCLDSFVGEDRNRVDTNLNITMEGKRSKPMAEYVAKSRTGRIFPVLIYSVPVYKDGVAAGTRGMVIDISDRKAAEQALLESEKKYRTLIDKATDGILITQDGVFKFVNPAFCEMMQYTEYELLNKPFIEVVDKKHHAEMLENHKRRMTGESFPAIYRAKLYRKDGKSIMVELNSRTTDFGGSPASFVITRDITDRLQVEDELIKAKAELERLNQNLEVRVKESTLKLTEANTQLIRLQKENLQSQFEVLRQQVNPHFLFNSLNVLTSLIKLEPDLAEKFTEHLSKVYRYVLENKDNDLVNLQTELDFLDAYIFLLNIRFMDKINVKVSIPETKKEMLILPLALQLLIENAIKHNSMSKKNPLTISIFIDEENILHVENNLQERESHMTSTGVGLKNIAHRYQLLEMPEPEFIKTETKFIARVPLKNQ